MSRAARTAVALPLATAVSLGAVERGRGTGRLVDGPCVDGDGP